MPDSIKAMGLVGMGLFLYSHFFNGTLLFYINERFVWLTFLAAVGFIIVGASYRYRSKHDHHHEHQHNSVSWGGLLLVMLPVILGLLVPARPLGAAAMSNRDVSARSLTSVAVPENGDVLTKPKMDKNVLDWLIEFRTSPDPAAFSGEEARVIGFVYRDDRFAADEFMVSRFVISCCAADAAPIGLLVRSPDGSQFGDDTWVQVTGTFESGQLDGETMPVLLADTIEPAEIPEQPYLYPY
jgi:putative membrane protein